MTTVLDLDAMLDSTLDAVEVPPEYCNEPPAGAYILKVLDVQAKAPKEEGKNVTLNITYAVEETVELVDKDEAPVPNSTLLAERFQVTEQGLGFFKRRALQVTGADSLDGASTRDIMEAMKGCQCNAVLSFRTFEGKDGKKYKNLNYSIKK